jgi:hypothetical protein
MITFFFSFALCFDMAEEVEEEVAGEVAEAELEEEMQGGRKGGRQYRRGPLLACPVARACLSVALSVEFDGFCFGCHHRRSGAFDHRHFVAAAG